MEDGTVGSERGAGGATLSGSGLEAWVSPGNAYKPNPASATAPAASESFVLMSSLLTVPIAADPYLLPVAQLR
jgi:hypothetical protein